MAIKVYKKRGAIHYSERKLVRQLEKVFEEKLRENPKFLDGFEPATNSEQLRNLHTKYCATDAEIISETINANPTGNMAKKKDSEEHVLSNEKETDFSETKSDMSGEDTIRFENPTEQEIDPMNEANAKVRDYVKGGDKMDPNAKKDTLGTERTFEEPTTASEAFSLPMDDVQESTDYFGQEKDKKGKKDSSGPKEKTTDTYNPEFTHMHKGTANKKTKRMAKYIMGAFCALLEHGVPYLATRDITPIALARAAKARQIDLSVILQLDNETQMSIAEFFGYMREQAKGLGKIPQELKDDLTEDLYDLLMEKGVAPTPIQSVMMGLLEVGMFVGLRTLEFRSQINEAKEHGKPFKKARYANEEAKNLVDHIASKKAEEKVETVHAEEEIETEEESDETTENTSENLQDQEDNYANNENTPAVIS